MGGTPANMPQGETILPRTIQQGVPWAGWDFDDGIWVDAQGHIVILPPLGEIVEDEDPGQIFVEEEEMKMEDGDIEDIDIEEDMDMDEADDVGVEKPAFEPESLWDQDEEGNQI